jgi:hypothetical protein
LHLNSPDHERSVYLVSSRMGAVIFFYAKQTLTTAYPREHLL